MIRLAIGLFICVAIGHVAEGRDSRTAQAFELKSMIEAIPSGTPKRHVESLLQSVALPYGDILRKDFRSHSATWMVEPLPVSAVSALTGSGGGRPGMDDDFVFFVVLFDSEEKSLAAKAKVLGYW